MNRTLFPSEHNFHPVQFPPDYLGQGEEHQIETRIQGFVESLKVQIALFLSDDLLLLLLLGFSSRIFLVHACPIFSGFLCLTCDRS